MPAELLRTVWARKAGVDDAGSGGSMTAVAAEVGRQLTKNLRAQVTELERDLLARARDVPEFTATGCSPRSGTSPTPTRKTYALPRAA